MTYYSVEAVMDRRINDDDGTVEYAVSWEGYGADDVTWERRHHVTENCAEMVQAVDQRCMDATDSELTQWRRSEWVRKKKSAPTSRQREGGATTTSTAATDTSPPLPHQRTGGQKRSRSTSRADDVAPCSPSCATAATQEDGAARAESEEEEDEEDVEVLSGLLLRAPQHSSGKSGEDAPPTQAEEATVLMLGEVVLAEEASAALNRGSGHRKKKQQTAARAALSLSTAPALETEKLWRKMHGQSLLHSVEVAHRVTPFRGHFHLHLPDAEMQQEMMQEATRSSHLRILSIAPPCTTHSGAVFGAPVALAGLVGEKDVEEMRLSVQLESPVYGVAAQDIVKPHVEQMVVRYVISENPSSSAVGGAHASLEPCVACEYVASMPLSVFRLSFPQLLIDYLLESSVVLH
ncbi:Chromo (CHRromatin Organization MOdifier) domain containing protein [Lotmaria passim]